MGMWLLGRLPTVPKSLSSANRAIVEGDVEEAVAARSRHGASLPLASALLHGTDEQVRRSVRMFDDLGAHGLAARARAMVAERGTAIPPGPDIGRGRRAPPLDPRRTEVLSLLAQGADEDEIGHLLLLTPEVVRDQVVLLLRRLEVPDVPAAVAAGRRLELV